jgi:hypothetical protein
MMMKRLHRQSIFSIFILLAVFASNTLFARSAEAQPKFQQFRWSETNKGFHISAVLQKGFTHEIEETINAGIPTTFHFYLYLKKMRWFWDNKIEASAEVIHTVTFDTLRKVYTISKQRVDSVDPNVQTTTEDPGEMRSQMNTFEGDLEFPADIFKADRQYYISLRATLRTDKLPPPWDTILFFMSHDFDAKTRRQFLPVITEK